MENTMTFEIMIKCLPISDNPFLEGLSTGIEGVLEICKGQEFTNQYELSGYAYIELVNHTAKEEVENSYDHDDQFDRGYYLGKLLTLRKISDWS